MSAPLDFYARLSERILRVDMWPRGGDDGPAYVEVDLMDTRAADGVRVHYDFERDGWVISQASTFEWGRR